MAMQLAYKLGLKIPPLSQAERTEGRGRLTHKFDQELIPLNNGILATHRFSYQLRNAVIVDSEYSDWWLPYDKREIMVKENRRRSDPAIRRRSGIPCGALSTRSDNQKYGCNPSSSTNLGQPRPVDLG
jgi:hypothetical protein